MKLVKTQENVCRSFVDGETIEHVEISYDIVKNGEIIGTVVITESGTYVNISLDTPSVEESKEKVRELLGIKEERL